MPKDTHPSYCHKFSVAPMLDWTDRHCRYFHRLLTKRSLLYTEMVVADAVIYGNKQRLLGFHDREQPLAVQLAGSDAHKIAEAAKICEDFGYSEIDLNVGCPSARVQSGAFGACLMLEPEKVSDAIKAIKKNVTIPVTVKCRIGVDDQKIPDSLNLLAKMCLDSGVDGFWIHARKAWLKGLSPKENRDIPPLNYECVYKFKQEHPDVFVGINGGIVSIEDSREHLNYVDGVMLGRAVYHNPSILFDVDNEIYGDKQKLSYTQLMQEMYAYIEQRLSEGYRLSHITKHMVGLFQGLRGARAWRTILSTQATQREADVSILRNAFENIKILNPEVVI